MKYYVVSDLHGYYEALIRALEEKGFFQEEHKKLIVCGDVLDRGKEAVKLVDFLLEQKDRGELIYITGNHEDLFVQALQAIARGEVAEIAYGISHHVHNGTWDTLLQLAETNQRKVLEFPNALIDKIEQTRFYQELLPSSIDHYETENYIFCHGWIPAHIEGRRPSVQYLYDANWRNASIDQWKKARWMNGMDLSCKFHVNEPGKDCCLRSLECLIWACEFRSCRLGMGRRCRFFTVLCRWYYCLGCLHGHERYSELHCYHRSRDRAKE